ncbi:MAG: type II secretion system protein [Leptolyngbya sp. PLA3]|nr:MAG: type II secretion system protein [Cyanobacteria bacterium CYA]MCE7967158.1 type II secretion system protein [Leptolyngbya sp. PL-A3]
MSVGRGSRAVDRSSRAQRRAFSLIELVVVIGIVMILIGLLMPGLASAREQAGRTRNLAAIRSALVLLNQYTDAYEDRYPIGWTDPVNASLLWYIPLRDAGTIDAWPDIGLLNREGDRSLIALTQTAFIDADVLDPEAGIDLNSASMRSQRTTDIRFPSDKGILWQYLSEGSRLPDVLWCCLPDAPRLPVAFADGSAVICDYKQFDVDPTPNLTLHVGTPVISTWFGLAGRDILRR